MVSTGERILTESRTKRQIVHTQTQRAASRQIPLLQIPADLHTATEGPRDRCATRTATHSSLHTTTRTLLLLLLLSRPSAAITGTEARRHRLKRSRRTAVRHLMASLTISTATGRFGPVTCCSAQSAWCVWRTL